MSKKLAIAIHHLNPWGGHDRSTLEIVRRLSRSLPLEVHTYDLHDPKLELWGSFKLRKVKPHIKKPALLLTLYFQLITGIRFIFNSSVVHSTGTSSLYSDVVQVQFISKAWREIQKNLDEKTYQRSKSRGASFLLKKIKYFYHQFLLSWNIWIEEKVYSPNKKYIAIADCVSKELQKYFQIPEKQITVIHHGVDSDEFHSQLSSGSQALKTKLGLSDADRVFIFVGEYERKGLSIVLQSLAGITENKRKGIKFLAIGGGDREGFQKMADDLGLKAIVQILGHQKNISDYYRIGNFFILPTFYEPFGLVILEAMACGLIPLVSKSAGASELIRDRENGFLIQDPTSVLETKLLLEKTMNLTIVEQQKMKNLALQTAKNRNWDQVAKEYEAVLIPMLE